MTRGVIERIVLGVWLGCVAAAAAQLPPEVLVDKHLLQAEMMREDNDHKGALEAMDRIVTLQKEHDLTLPEAFSFQYAQTALAAGSMQAAIDSANRYLSAVGREGKYYREALELLVKAEQSLREMAPGSVETGKAEIEPEPQAVSPSPPQAQRKTAVQPAPDCGTWNTKKFFRKATVEEVTACINAASDLDAQDGGFFAHCTKCTPLQRAAIYSENTLVVQALIDAGAQVDAQDGFTGSCTNCTPLHLAVLYNKNPGVIETLLGAGADPNVKHKWGSTPLHMAAWKNRKPAVIDALLKAGADPNMRSESKNTPLHTAARYSTPEVVEVLLAAGADQAAWNEKGKTPLQRARKRNKKVLRQAWANLSDSQKAAHRDRVRRKKASAGPSFLDVAVGVAGGAAIAAAGRGTEEAVEAGTVFKEGVISGQKPVGSSAGGYPPTPTGGEGSSSEFDTALRNLEDSCGESYRSAFSEKNHGRFYCLDAFARHCALKKGHNQQQLDALRHDFEVLRSQGQESGCPYFGVFGVTYEPGIEREAIDRAEKEARKARQERQRRLEEQARQAAQQSKRLIEENNARVLASGCECISRDEKDGKLTCLDGFVGMTCDIKR